MGKPVRLTGFFLVALFFLPLLSSGNEGRVSVNLWPLFGYTSDPATGETEIVGAGPLFHWKKKGPQAQWGVRPAFYWTEDEAEPLQRFEYLYPFGKYQNRKGEKKSYFSPVHSYKEEVWDGKKRWDFQLFPFFFGETIREEGYGGVFPLFGTLLDRYGKKDIRFYLWPLYSRTESEGYVARNFLWPFVGVTEGEKRKGLRLWPVYGWKEEVGISRIDFYLWPVFFHQVKGLDSEYPVEEKIVFPLYLSKESARSEKKTVLWPFFSRFRDRFTGFEQWDVLYPIFRTRQGPEVNGGRIFPFYGYDEYANGNKSSFILYPLYIRKEVPLEDGREKTVRILLFSRIRSGGEHPETKKEYSLRIWPFFDYEKGETGEEALSILYLIPFKDGGLERNMVPLFRIFQWEKGARGDNSTQFLWGLYKRTEREGSASWEVAHLVRWNRGVDSRRVSFIHGLFQYNRRGEAVDLRLFFIPFSLKGSGVKVQSKTGKEFADGSKEDRDPGNGVLCSRQDPLEFRP
jgi:hypothetical protein